MNQNNFEYKNENKYETPQNMMGDCTIFEGMNCGSNSMCPPIQEHPQERVCHRYFCYDVPHVIPCNTRVINHHVYRHTYTPYYTTWEENVVSNVYDRKCC